MEMVKLVILSMCIVSCHVQKSSQSIELFNTSYRVFGSGDPLLIINGGPGMNSDGFAPIAKEIAAMGFQTIIYDQRGTGLSKLNKIDSTTITMDLMVDDIENLRKKLKIKKWSVFGHSFGGIMATYYLSKHPSSIDKVIFSSSGGVNMNFLQYLGDRYNQLLTKAEQDSLTYYENADLSEEEKISSRAKILAKAYVFDKSHAPVIAQRLTQLDRKINGLVIDDLLRIKFDFTYKMLGCKVPVLVIQGKDDIIMVETAQEIFDSFGNAKMVLLDNCGHYGWLDAREKFMSSVNEFLGN